MNDRCDHCRGKNLTRLYQVPGSQRNLSVYLCEHCGLVQSLPRADHIGSRDVAVSAGANWGNVRYGKGFRTDAAIDLLRQAKALEQTRAALDVGANRGAFVLRLRQLAPDARITAVEPDARVMTDYTGNDTITAINGRIENEPLMDNHYDLIHCSHTLEHLHSPRRVLAQLQRALSEDGVLFIEVPNIAFIGQENVVEEWFIDKHLYHYSPETLIAALQQAGFHCPEEWIRVDTINISLIATKGEAGETVPPHPEEVKTQARQLISRYETALRNNHRKLQRAARRLEDLANQGRRIAIWGAGRIFDALMTEGELDPAAISALLDKRLPDFVDQVHGLPIRKPESIADATPDLVVIMSREYADEIGRELDRYLPGCDRLVFSELMSQDSVY